jgi:hypothetical protein
MPSRVFDEEGGAVVRDLEPGDHPVLVASHIHDDVKLEYSDMEDIPMNVRQVSHQASRVSASLSPGVSGSGVERPMACSRLGPQTFSGCR